MLEAGYFYPFRMKQPLPDATASNRLGAGDPSADRRDHCQRPCAKARELLSASHNEFWEAICREPVKPDKKSDPEVIAPTTVAARQKVAIQKFAEFLNTLELESAAMATVRLRQPNCRPRWRLLTSPSNHLRCSLLR